MNRVSEIGRELSELLRLTQNSSSVESRNDDRTVITHNSATAGASDCRVEITSERFECTGSCSKYDLTSNSENLFQYSTTATTECSFEAPLGRLSSRSARKTVGDENWVISFKSGPSEASLE